MLSGNNGNTIPQVYMNENQLQYQSSTQSNQLHLLGTIGGGCNVDPINYFANDNLGPMIRPNKRGREAESYSNIQRQQKLQMSLNYNHNNNIGVGEEVLKENLVSTGLKLSYNDDEPNSSMTSASGNIVAVSSIFQSLDDNLRNDLHRQKDELDQVIKVQAAQMAKGVREIKQRHISSFLNTLEKGVSKKLQEKDLEIDNINKKNRKLVNRVKQLAMEAQNWQYKAKYNESVVNVLKTKLQQAMSDKQNHNNAIDQGREGFGDSEIDDAASSYIDPNNKMVNQRMRCKMCNVKEVSVLIVPCRHLSLCKECDVLSGFCPVCNCLKSSSVEVFFS